MRSFQVNPSGTTFRLPPAVFGRVAALLAVAVSLSGCGLAAAPCRLVSAVAKAIPVVGHQAAAPTDACAVAIDP